MKNPAQDGIDGAKEDARNLLIAERMIEEFKAFVLDQIKDGCMLGESAESPERQVLEVLKNAMDIYVDLLSEEIK